MLNRLVLLAGGIDLMAIFEAYIAQSAMSGLHIKREACDSGPGVLYRTHGT